jgi:hypothetical protein
MYKLLQDKVYNWFVNGKKFIALQMFWSMC